LGVGLREGFEDVEGVADEGADAAGDGAGEEFQVEGGVGGAGSDGVSDGGIWILMVCLFVVRLRCVEIKIFVKENCF